MSRDLLKKMLLEYSPKNSEQQKYKQQMLDFLEQYPNCFERSLEIGHFTASAWLINKENTKALLMHHVKLNRWLQLGGHADGETDLLAVAIKEAQEESGILNIEPCFHEIFDIGIHLIPENKKEKAHYHYDVRFLLKVTSDEIGIKNHESHDLRWILKDGSNLPEKSETVLGMFHKWKELDQIN